MVIITDKNRFIEFAFSNETHLIEKSNIKFIRLDEFVAVYDNSDRQRNDKRFIIKFDEVSNSDFANGASFYDWLSKLIGAETPQEKDTRNTNENTRELRLIKDVLKEQLKYLKKIYNPE